jgi:hypothetical protein
VKAVGRQAGGGSLVQAAAARSADTSNAIELIVRTSSFRRRGPSMCFLPSFHWERRRQNVGRSEGPVGRSATVTLCIGSCARRTLVQTSTPRHRHLIRIPLPVLERGRLALTAIAVHRKEAAGRAGAGDPVAAMRAVPLMRSLRHDGV